MLKSYFSTYTYHGNTQHKDQCIQNVRFRSQKRYCFTHRCQLIRREDFWIAIFKRDTLPLFDESYDHVNVLQIYYKTYQAVKEADLILKLIMQEKCKEIKIESRDNHLNIILHDKGTFYMSIKNNQYIIRKYDNVEKIQNTITYDVNEIRDMFITFIYVYSDVKIDSFCNDAIYKYIPLRKKHLNIKSYPRRFSGTIQDRLTFYKAFK